MLTSIELIPSDSDPTRDHTSVASVKVGKERTAGTANRGPRILGPHRRFVNSRGLELVQLSKGDRYSNRPACTNCCAD